MPAGGHVNQRPTRTLDGVHELERLFHLEQVVGEQEHGRCRSKLNRSLKIQDINVQFIHCHSP